MSLEAGLQLVDCCVMIMVYYVLYRVRTIVGVMVHKSKIHY